MAKLAAAAIACDFARIVTIQDTEYDSQSFSWLGVSFPQRWHLYVHDRSPMAQIERAFQWYATRHAVVTTAAVAKAQIERAFQWYATAFKDILDAMAAIPEGDGTLLDHSLVVWITEYSDGASHDTHGIPVVWAGGLGGAVHMNRFVSFSGTTSSTNRIFVTIMKLFGMPDNSFGVGKRNSGTLPGIV